MTILRKKTALAPGSRASGFVSSLSRALDNRMPTLDRRSFLKRSGVGVGVGIAAGQLTFVRKAEASPESVRQQDGKGKIEVKRTVCSHCSVGCAIDAVV